MGETLGKLEREPAACRARRAAGVLAVEDGEVVEDNEGVEDGAPREGETVREKDAGRRRARGQCDVIAQICVQ